MSVPSSDFVNVFISTSCEPNTIERRFQRGLTIEALKQKMELVTGASASTMKLSVYDRNDQLVCRLENDDALFGSYPVDDKMRIHVEDSFLLKKQIEDENDAGTKFELTDEDYSKRQETLQAYLKANKLGKYNKEEMEKREAEKKKERLVDEDKIKSITIGSRCQVSVPEHPVRRATVRYSGEVKFASGLWVGVQYDEPMGKNDGSVQGVRYFECPPKYGGFVKPSYVEVGDFPEEEINFDDEL